MNHNLEGEIHDKVAWKFTRYMSVSRSLVALQDHQKPTCLKHTPASHFKFSWNSSSCWLMFPRNKLGRLVSQFAPFNWGDITREISTTYISPILICHPEF